MLIWTPADRASEQVRSSNEGSEKAGRTKDQSQHTVIEEANNASKSHDSSHDSSGQSHDSSSKSHDSTPAAATAVSSLATANDRGNRRSKGKVKRVIEVLHVDIIGDKFWTEHADILRSE